MVHMCVLFMAKGVLHRYFSDVLPMFLIKDKTHELFLYL